MSAWTKPRSLDEVIHDPADPEKQAVAQWFAGRFIDMKMAERQWLKLVRVAYKADGSLKDWEAAENETIVWLVHERDV